MRLIVHFNGIRAGCLEEGDAGILRFTYDPAWLLRDDSVPLSRQLPLTDKPFHGKQVRCFFAGLLPEEGPRQRITEILGISAGNDFALLEHIGGECAGAVSLLPEEAGSPAAGDGGARELSDEKLARVLTELPVRPLMAGIEGVRLSLAGAQGKLPVQFHDGRFFLPLGATPSTHILKPEPERFPGLVANEYFCMTLARAVGLEAPEVGVGRAGETPYLVVERYDRIEGKDGRIKRLHQEDFCQALGYAPERKYQQEGGPGVRECVTLLRNWSGAPVVDIAAFVDGLVFNAIIGNADAHGKNWSLLYDGKVPRLAPLYDLVCTLVWPNLSRRLSMKIGRCDTLTEITPAHFRAMAAETGLGWPMVRERIADLVRRVGAGIDRAAEKAGAAGKESVMNTVDIVRTRAARFAEI